MRLFVHWKGLPSSESARLHLHRRLNFSLSRFAQRIQRVRALLMDENAHRGGVDKSCRLQVHTRAGLVQVEGRDRDLYVAIDLAGERLQRTLGRLLEREHFQNTGSWRAQGLSRRRSSALRLLEST